RVLGRYAGGRDVVEQVAQPAVDHARRAAGRAGAPVFALEERHGHAAQGGVAGRAGTVDAAADDHQVVNHGAQGAAAAGTGKGPAGATMGWVVRTLDAADGTLWKWTRVAGTRSSISAGSGYGGQPCSSPWRSTRASSCCSVPASSSRP